MQPPLPVGTILQHHYRLLKLLGQGGFGRTYLAEDQARFNELCVLKEYTPRGNQGYILKKSKELFQREAEVLYKIKHLQIPQFRGTFEQGKRLFLVQDYAEGKNYSTLLQERQKEGRTFSESEIVEFLQQILPILVHIHEKGIIHRDISPDNIILRQSDRLPVLIDFGAVKEIAAQLDSIQDILPATTIGKIGYAPPEQLQTGKVYPNSDIYALGVTALVLITGRKPQELLDRVTMTWRWELFPTTLSLGVCYLLKKMTAPKPNNRYQSAIEVSQALREWGGIIATTKTAKESPPIGQTKLHSAINTTNSLDNNLSYLPLIGATMGFFVIFGFFFLFAAMLPPKRQRTPDQVQRIPTSKPIIIIEFLNLTTAEKTVREGSLKANQTITYKISVQQGQILSTSVSGQGVVMNLLAPNLVPINSQAQQVQHWEGELTLTGQYAIELILQPGISETNYKFDILLTNSQSPTIQPSFNPLPSPF